MDNFKNLISNICFVFMLQELEFLLLEFLVIWPNIIFFIFR